MSASLTIEDIEDALRRVLDTHNRSPWLDSEAAAVYGGIDFKSKGGQVVAAGSIHPGSQSRSRRAPFSTSCSGCVRS